MGEDDLLKLFEVVHVDIGKLKSRDIKAWFDTDCAPMLEWMCSTISEECYLSVQQDAEFAQLDHIFSPEEIAEKKEVIDHEYPGLFDIESNRHKIAFASDIAEMLEEEICDLDHEIFVNKNLHDRLLAEYSQLCAEELKLKTEEETAQEQCEALSKNLDLVNHKLHDQIIKYGMHLYHYGYAETPTFANDIDFVSIEEELHGIMNYFSADLKNNDMSEMSFAHQLTDTLASIRNRIFSSIAAKDADKMVMEGLKSTLNFLKQDNNGILSSLEIELGPIFMHRGNKSPALMLEVIEKNANKQADHYISQSTVKCLNDEFESYQLTLNNLSTVEETLNKILVHLINANILYLQENEDINNSSKFFKTITKYVKNDIQHSISRKKQMSKLIYEFEEFSSLPFEKKICIMNNAAAVSAKGDFSDTDFNNQITMLSKIATKKVVNALNNLINLEFSTMKKSTNNQLLRDFLTTGPTLQFVIIPHDLKLLLSYVNDNLAKQEASIKRALVLTTQKSKNHMDWPQIRNQLWIHFMTDGLAMLEFFDKCKQNKTKLC